MREIKFRAKNQLGSWEYGGIIHITETYKGDEDVQECDIWQMVNYEGICFDVDKETIGQFTGLYDKNKVPIYEGDIVETKYGEKYTVEFKTERAGFYPFACGDGCGCCEEETWSADCSEILGNIYENSDLLGE